MIRARLFLLFFLTGVQVELRAEFQENAPAAKASGASKSPTSQNDRCNAMAAFPEVTASAWIFRPDYSDTRVNTGFEYLTAKAAQFGVPVSRLLRTNKLAHQYWRQIGAHIEQPHESHITARKLFDFLEAERKRLKALGLTDHQILVPATMARDREGRLHGVRLDKKEKQIKEELRIPPSDYIEIVEQIAMYAARLQPMGHGSQLLAHDFSHFFGLSADPESMKETIRLSQIFMASEFGNRVIANGNSEEAKLFKKRYYWATEWTFLIGDSPSSIVLPDTNTAVKQISRDLEKTLVKDPEQIAGFFKSFLIFMDTCPRIGGGAGDFYNTRNRIKEGDIEANSLAGSLEQLYEIEFQINSNGGSPSVSQLQEAIPHLAQALKWAAVYQRFPPAQWLRWAFQQATGESSPLTLYLQKNQDLFKNPLVVN